MALLVGMNAAHGKPLAMVGPWEIHSVDPASNGVFFTRMQVAETLVEVDGQAICNPDSPASGQAPGMVCNGDSPCAPGPAFTMAAR